jgi:hypothetical protein
MAIANRSLASLPKTRVRDLELKFALIGKQKLFDLVMFTYTGVHVPAIPRSVSKALSLERNRRDVPGCWIQKHQLYSMQKLARFENRHHESN